MTWTYLPWPLFNPLQLDRNFPLLTGVIVSSLPRALSPLAVQAPCIVQELQAHPHEEHQLGPQPPRHSATLAGMGGSQVMSQKALHIPQGNVSSNVITSRLKR